MKVAKDEDELTYTIDWKDVVLLLESQTRFTRAMFSGGISCISKTFDIFADDRALR